MLESVKIARRQSEIRETLAGLVGKADLTEDETRSIETLDAEYRSNETRYRGALIVEDSERREAKDDLETRSDKEYADLVSRFELRQVAQFLDTGDKITARRGSGRGNALQGQLSRHSRCRWMHLEMRSGKLSHRHAGSDSDAADHRPPVSVERRGARRREPYQHRHGRG